MPPSLTVPPGLPVCVCSLKSVGCQAEGEIDSGDPSPYFAGYIDVHAIAAGDHPYLASRKAALSWMVRSAFFIIVGITDEGKAYRKVPEFSKSPGVEPGSEIWLPTPRQTVDIAQQFVIPWLASQHRYLGIKTPTVEHLVCLLGYANSSYHSEHSV